MKKGLIFAAVVAIVAVAVVTSVNVLPTASVAFIPKPGS